MQGRYITSGACKFTCMNMAYNSFVSSLFIEHLRENVAIHQKQDFRIINAIAEHKILQHLLPLHYNHTQIFPDEENSARYYRGRFYKSVNKLNQCRVMTQQMLENRRMYVCIFRSPLTMIQWFLK